MLVYAATMPRPRAEVAPVDRVEQHISRCFDITLNVDAQHHSFVIAICFGFLLVHHGCAALLPLFEDSCSRSRIRLTGLPVHCLDVQISSLPFAPLQSHAHTLRLGCTRPTQTRQIRRRRHQTQRKAVHRISPNRSTSLCKNVRTRIHCVCVCHRLF